MQNNWPTKDYDLRVAADIIQKHVELNDYEPIGMFEVKVGEKISLCLADWIVELNDYFIAKYGDERGDIILKNILSQCIRQGETVH